MVQPSIIAQNDKKVNRDAPAAGSTPDKIARTAAAGAAGSGAAGASGAGAAGAAPADYLPTIGVECHVQLCTKTKLFSEVDNDARLKEPNSCVSPVDYGLPGMLPRLNGEAVRLAIRAGLALGSTINLESRFDRKHYYYPDLPKGYQITQMYHPLVGAGAVALPDGTQVRVEHAHLEEDAGKLSHIGNYSLVDLNRAGTPLLEIVSLPDIHSAAQARDYCKELWRLMTYAGVTFGDLYNGNMRFDVNISIAPAGATELGTRTEVKNLNSFRSVERAIDFEIKRQAKLLRRGEAVRQETRGWNDATGETTAQRSKEAAQDYRYMPEPDIPPLRLTAADVDEQQALLPKLPASYRAEFGGILPADTLEILLDYPLLVAKLDEIGCTPDEGQSDPSGGQSDPSGGRVRPARRHGRPALVLALPRSGFPQKGRSVPASAAPIIKRIANLFTSVLLAEENASLLNDELPTRQQLLDLAVMAEKNELSSTGAKEVFLKFFDPEMHYKDTQTIAKELGVLQENDLGALEAIVDAVLQKPETKKAQDDYRAGEAKVLGFLVGQVMKESKGKANPSAVQDILRRKLNG